METVENIIETPAEQRGKLLKILGVTFGIAVTIGGMIGLGILRTPKASRSSRRQSRRNRQRLAARKHTNRPPSADWC